MQFHDRFDAAAVLRDLPYATVFMGVPTFYTRLLGEPAFDQSLCKNMRLFISGSAPLLDATFEEFRERTEISSQLRRGNQRGRGEQRLGGQLDVALPL